MRFLSLFRKTMIENFRDWKILVLVLTFAPFFVLLMYFYFGESVQTYPTPADRFPVYLRTRLPRLRLIN